MLEALGSKVLIEKVSECECYTKEEVEMDMESKVFVCGYDNLMKGIVKNIGENVSSRVRVDDDVLFRISEVVFNRYKELGSPGGMLIESCNIIAKYGDEKTLLVEGTFLDKVLKKG